MPYAVVVQPDPQVMAINFLRASVAMTAVVSTRVSGALPASPTFPFVVVNPVFGSVVAERHIYRVRLQVDAFGTTKENASLAARTAHAVLVSIQGEVSALGVMDSARTVLAPRWLPDQTLDQGEPRPRFSFDIELTYHNLPSSS